MQSKRTKSNFLQLWCKDKVPARKHTYLSYFNDSKMFHIPSSNNPQMINLHTPYFSSSLLQGCSQSQLNSPHELPSLQWYLSLPMLQTHSSVFLSLPAWPAEETQKPSLIRSVHKPPKPWQDFLPVKAGIKANGIVSLNRDTEEVGARWDVSSWGTAHHHEQ